MNKAEINELKAELKQFSGSEEFYEHLFFHGYVYTEGVQYLAEKTEAYWLVDYIFSNQWAEEFKVQPFQVWKLTVAHILGMSHHFQKFLLKLLL